MARPYSALRERLGREFRFVSAALLVDWIVVLALGVVSHYIELRYPYERPLAPYLDDPYYHYPLEREQVPSGVGLSRLELVAWYLPLAIICVVAASRKSFHDLHHGVLGLSASRASMRVTVEFLKTQVGRLRPSFFSRCDYDPVTEACHAVSREALALVKDGRKSFPSGHSSTAWQGLAFVALFLAGKNGALALATAYPRSTWHQSRFLRLSVVVLPLFLAAWVSITRLQDHWHHPTDVLAGAAIGTACSLLTYSIYYPNPFKVVGSNERDEGHGEVQLELESKRLKELGTPRDIYGALERATDGEIRLGEGASSVVDVSAAEGEDQV